MASSSKKKRKEEIIEKDIDTSSSEDVESDSSESDIDPELVRNGMKYAIILFLPQLKVI